MVLSLFVFIKSFSLKGSSPPKPWLCIGIVGFCNGGISFLTGVKFFYIKVLNFNLWSKCLRLNWINFSTPMENRCWNRRYLIVWLILIPLQESYLTSSIASCTCLPTSLLFSFLWRWKLQTHGWWICFFAKGAVQISSDCSARWRSNTNASTNIMTNTCKITMTNTSTNIVKNTSTKKWQIKLKGG